MYISLKKLAGEHLDNSVYGGTTAVDPSIQFHWHVQGDAMGGGNLTCDLQIKLTYYVKWYHRQMVDISTSS